MTNYVCMYIFFPNCVCLDKILAVQEFFPSRSQAPNNVREDVAASAEVVMIRAVANLIAIILFTLKITSVI